MSRISDFLTAPFIKKTWHFDWTGHKEPKKKESELFKNRLKDQEVTPRAEEGGLNG